MSEVLSSSLIKRRPVSPDILEKVHLDMPKPPEDRTRISDILRLSKGGYSRSRRKQHLLIKSPQK
jgi:hypothetical protein